MDICVKGDTTAAVGRGETIAGKHTDLKSQGHSLYRTSETFSQASTSIKLSALVLGFKIAFFSQPG